jgi:hypothetical protein
MFSDVSIIHFFIVSLLFRIVAGWEEMPRTRLRYELGAREFLSTTVADLNEAKPPPLFFSSEIYHKVFVKLKIWDPEYVNFLLHRRAPPPPSFEISGSATELSWSNPADHYTPFIYNVFPPECVYARIDPLAGILPSVPGHEVLQMEKNALPSAREAVGQPHIAIRICVLYGWENPCSTSSLCQQTSLDADISSW